MAACFASTAAFPRAPALRLASELGTHPVASPPDGAAEPPSPLRLRWAGSLAQAASRAEPSAKFVPVIVTVRLNGIDKGEHGIFLRGEDELLIPRALLAEWVPAIVPDSTIAVEGEPHVALRALPGARVRFDEQQLALHLDLPPQGFPAQSVRYLASDRPAPSAYEGLSVMVNYQLAATGPVDGPGSDILSATVEAAVRRREWLLRGSVYQSRSGSESTSGRGLTFLAREDPFALTRLTIGDFNTGSSEVNGGLVLGGISFARALDLDPYTVRQPGAAVREMVDTPSTIDVYVGDNRILRQAVGPGPVDISNLTYLAGRRDVRVVVRDAFGRERETTFPFYFADRGLAPGVHDYNYGVGLLRRDLSGLRGSYANPTLAAFHRAGLTDVVTVGAEVQASRDVGNVGPGVTLRMDRLGILSVAALASYDRVRDRTGGAAALGYSFLGERFSGGVFARAATREFVPVGLLADGQPPPESDAGFSLSYTLPGFGTITASASERRPRFEARTRNASLGYSFSISRSWQLQALWRRSDGPRPEREAFISLQYADGKHLGRATYRDSEGRQGALVQYGTFQPIGEGFGYTLTGESVREPEGNRNTFTPEFVWNMRHAALQGSLIQAQQGSVGSTSAYQLALTGSLAAVGGQVGFSRAAQDSFAVVRIVPPIAGVRVYLNEQLMGRTDGAGRLFLPRLVSSIVNGVSIDDRDLPLERSLDKRVASVVPWPRGGLVLDFEAPLRRSIDGVFLYRSGDSWLPLKNAVVRIAAPSGEMLLPTGNAGEFYLEGLPAGAHAASVELDGRSCAFTLRVPASEQAQIRLQDVQTCAPS